MQDITAEEKLLLILNIMQFQGALALHALLLLVQTKWAAHSYVSPVPRVTVAPKWLPLSPVGPEKQPEDSLGQGNPNGSTLSVPPNG